MSKIGRKAIPLGDVTVEIQGHVINYKGKNNSGSYVLPDVINAEVKDNMLYLNVPDKMRNRTSNSDWGLHHALLANRLQGAGTGFTKKLIIEGLGYKANVAGSKVVFSLGYTHKIELSLPAGVTLEVDKSGQKLLFRATDKQILGEVCAKVRAMRPPEPYKGTGVRYADEVIARKAGKTKAA